MGKARRKKKVALGDTHPGIGYDGHAPVFMAARDVVGHGRREKVDGPQNIAIDRLEWMLAKKLIERHHHAAGRKLQDLWQTAELSSGIKLMGGGGGNPSNTSLSDAKCDAFQAVGRVRVALSPLAWRVLDLVVIENKTAGEASKIMGFHERAAMPNLMHGLDALARHFKMC